MQSGAHRRRPAVDARHGGANSSPARWRRSRRGTKRLSTRGKIARSAVNQTPLTELLNEPQTRRRHDVRRLGKLFFETYNTQRLANRRFRRRHVANAVARSRAARLHVTCIDSRTEWSIEFRTSPAAKGPMCGTVHARCELRATRSSFA